jgi:uncharacterized protein with FMN-binding domain
MRRVILAIASTAVVLGLLLSFKSHTQTPALVPAALGPGPGTVSGSPSTGTATAPASGSSATPTAGATTDATSGSTSAGARTITGDAVLTIYGPVQVKITVADGKVTAAAAIEYPDGTPRDYQINSFAIPQLQQETVGVSSPNIDAVSGATYTSQGYIGSLQSALDKAGL